MRELETAYRLFDEASGAGPFGADSISNKGRAASNAVDRAKTAFESAESNYADLEDALVTASGVTAFDVPLGAVALYSGLLVGAFAFTEASFGTIITVSNVAFFYSLVGPAGLVFTLSSGTVISITGLGVTITVGSAPGVFGIATLPGFFAGLSGFLLVFAALVPVNQLTQAQNDARSARDLIYTPFQPAKPRVGRFPATPEVPESGGLVDARKQLADWRASPLARSNLQTSVDQAAAFRDVVSGQITRTDCR